MATYQQIQTFVKETYGYFPKSCWIAHMKEMCGLHPRVSPNRFSVDIRTNPCPIDKQADIKMPLFISRCYRLCYCLNFA